MTSAGHVLLAEADLIVPMPLHYFRLVWRSFNQPVWLAAGVSRASGVPMSVSILKRAWRLQLKAGFPQAVGAATCFRVRKGKQAKIRDQKILLVDDVLTTGAAAEVCSRDWKRAGASCVDVLTLARVAAPPSLPI
jgi:predicted amidophosphoribosyltransferase